MVTALYEDLEKVQKRYTDLLTSTIKASKLFEGIYGNDVIAKNIYGSFYNPLNWGTSENKSTNKGNISRYSTYIYNISIFQQELYKVLTLNVTSYQIQGAYKPSSIDETYKRFINELSKYNGKSLGRIKIDINELNKGLQEEILSIEKLRDSLSILSNEELINIIKG